MKTRVLFTISKALLGGVLGSALILPMSASAQDFPSRPVKLIIPFAPGGATDSIGRLLATHLSKRLGQAVIADNRAGAGGQIGISYTIKLPADGYNLVLAGADGLAMGPALKRQKPFDAMNDLTPVSLVASSPLVFAAGSKFSGKTMGDLVNLAKASPGRVTFGSAGVGSALHLGVELLQANTGIKLVHVPYQGGAPMMQALISNQVDFVLTSPDFAARYAVSGQAKAIAQADVKRHPLLPDTPTVVEQGMKDLIVTSWFGVFGPPNMPKSIVERLDAEIAAIARDPAFQSQLIQIGAQVQYMGPGQFHEYIGSEVKRWAQVIQKAQIPLQD